MASESGTVADGSAEVGKPKPRATRKRRRWLVLLLLIGGLVWALPWIVGSTQLKQTLTYQVLPWLPPGATFESPSLGWTAPIHLSQVRILDHEGRVLLECDHVTSKKSLWEMAKSPSSPGGWDLENPRLTVRVGPQGTNLDPILRDALSQGTGGKMLDIQVSLSQGQIDILEASEQAIARIREVAASYGNEGGRGTITGSARFEEPATAGGLKIDGDWASDPGAIPEFDLQVALDHWPARIVEPIVAAHSSIARLDGTFSASLKAKVETTSGGDAKVDADLTVSPAGVRFQRQNAREFEPLETKEIVSRINGDWDREKDRIDITELGFDSDLLTLTGSGTVEQAREAAVLNLSGTLDRDVSSLLSLLSPEMQRHIQVTGLRMDQWAVQGPLRPAPELVLAGNVTWTTAGIFGLQAQPGSIDAAWGDQRIDLAPRDVGISGGRLAALPAVELTPQLGLAIPPGPMLVDVAFTEEQCRGWLRFLSPILANATSAAGNFSVELEKGNVPFSELENAHVQGTLVIQSGRMGPGPVARQTIDVVSKVAEILGHRLKWAQNDVWLDLPAQKVPFSLEQGRVHHQGFLVNVGELSIVSSGSVGLDESVEVQLALRLPDSWLGSNPLLARFKNQPVTVSLAGTLDRPQIRSESLKDLGKQLGAQAAGGLLQKLLDRVGDK